jgi:hypothetical protein
VSNEVRLFSNSLDPLDLTSSQLIGLQNINRIDFFWIKSINCNVFMTWRYPAFELPLSAANVESASYTEGFTVSTNSWAFCSFSTRRAPLIFTAMLGLLDVIEASMQLHLSTLFDIFANQRRGTYSQNPLDPPPWHFRTLGLGAVLEDLHQCQNEKQTGQNLLTRI